MAEAERNDAQMPMQSPEQVLTTLTKEGKRAWMYPRVSKGRYLTMRRVVAYVLIGVFTVLPYCYKISRPYLVPVRNY